MPDNADRMRLATATMALSIVTPTASIAINSALMCRDYGPRSAIVNPVCGLIRGGGGTGPKRRYSGAPPGIVIS